MQAHGVVEALSGPEGPPFAGYFAQRVCGSTPCGHLTFINAQGVLEEWCEAICGQCTIYARTDSIRRRADKLSRTLGQRKLL